MLNGATPPAGEEEGGGKAEGVVLFCHHTPSLESCTQVPLRLRGDLADRLAELLAVSDRKPSCTHHHHQPQKN